MPRLFRKIRRALPAWLWDATRAAPKRRRDARAQRRPGRVALWPLAAGLLFSVTMGELLMGGKGIAAVAAAVADPLSLLAQRSPGGRDPGAKFSTKGGKKTAAQGNPASPFQDPQAYFAQPFDGMPDIDMPLLPLGPDQIVPVPDMALAGPPGVFSPIGGPGMGVPVPGGLTPRPTTPTPPTTPPTTVPLVPEPATWAMLIFGFFAAGLALRRNANSLRRA
jgi:hypothetical protein